MWWAPEFCDIGLLKGMLNVPKIIGVTNVTSSNMNGNIDPYVFVVNWFQEVFFQQVMSFRVYESSYCSMQPINPLPTSKGKLPKLIWR